MVLDAVPHRFRGVAYQVVRILESPQGKEVGIDIVLYNLAHHALFDVSAFQSGQEVGCLKEGECTVVMTVVSTEPVGYRRLRRYGFQCRMVTGSGHGSLETIVADSPSTYVPVVVGVFQQPLDGVVSVCGFVNVLFVFRAFLVLVQWTDLNEIAFAFVTSANVLIDDDVVLLYIGVERCTQCTCEAFTVG